MRQAEPAPAPETPAQAAPVAKPVVEDKPVEEPQAAPVKPQPVAPAAKPEPAKTVKTPSVKPAKPEAKTQPKQVKAAAAPVKANYILKSAMAGEAWIAAADHPQEMRKIRVGDTVPGLGRIKAIVSKDGAWVVVGSKRTLP